MLICLALKLPHEFMINNLPGIYIFPGILFYIANFMLVIQNLFPCHVNINGMNLSTDGLQMLKIPLLTAREVAEQFAIHCLIDGQNCESKGNYTKAIESFNKAIRNNPDCFQAYWSRGNTYKLMKENRQAISNYRLAIENISCVIKLEQLNAHYYFSRAMIYYGWMQIDLTKSENAIKDLNKAISINPNNKNFYCIRASIYCCSGCEIQAIKDFTKIIQLDPSADSYYNRGIIYYQFTKYQSAIEDFDMAISFDSGRSSIYYSRGNARYDLQDKLGAFQDYSRAKLLSSNETVMSSDEYSFYASGIAHIRLENKDKATKDFQMAESLCLKHGNTSLLQQVREELEKITLKRKRICEEQAPFNIRIPMRDKP
jgi:tetratricopeptide (TPR) repeat protein